VPLTLYNASGQDICFVHISPTTSDTWGDDWLGSSEIIADGDNRTFTVAPGTYDLQALDCSQGEIAVEWELEVTSSTAWTVDGESTSSGGGGDTGGGSSGGTADSTLTLNNYLDVPICYVYIVPTGSTDWGDDWLGSSEILDPDTSRDFALPAGTYDLRAEDCSHQQLYLEEGLPINGVYPVMVGGGMGGAGDPGTTSVALINNSSEDICYAYYYPVGSSSWGDNALWEGDVIAPGQRIWFSTPQGIFDLRAENCNRQEVMTTGSVDLRGGGVYDWVVTGGTSSGGGSSGPMLTVYNDSGQTICELYISSTSATTWGENWLPPGDGSSIPSGNSRSFTVNADSYDLQAADCNGNEIATEWDFAVTSDATWTVGGSGGGSSSGGGSAQYKVTLHNNSDLTICYVYFSVTGSSVWSDDQLGSSEVVGPNTTREFFLDAGTYDFYAQGCNHDQIDLRESVVLEQDVDWNIYQREP
jgi:hypothetical protein